MFCWYLYTYMWYWYIFLLVFVRFNLIVFSLLKLYLYIVCLNILSDWQTNHFLHGHDYGNDYEQVEEMAVAVNQLMGEGVTRLSVLNRYFHHQYHLCHSWQDYPQN